MSGLQRYMDILHLFNDGADAWTIQAMADALSVPASTVYRTARDLVNAGLLNSAGESRYRLGVAFIEFDRKIRTTDPLIKVGQPMLRNVVHQAQIPCVGLLSRLYEDEVMCIANQATGDIDFESSYDRGKPMPLTRGATSKVILAQLPTRVLDKLLKQRANGNENVERLRGTLSEIYKRGYCVSYGEVDDGLIGLSAPLVCQKIGLIASLSLVVRAQDANAETERRLLVLLMAAAQLLTETLTKDSAISSRSVRKGEGAETVKAMSLESS